MPSKERRRSASRPAPHATLRHGSHATQVFGGPFPYGEVAVLARSALEAGEAVVVILQKSRLARMKAHLGEQRRVLYGDTRVALEAMTQRGRLDEGRFMATLGPLVEKAANLGNGRVAVFTDAAGTLVLDGRLQDSRALEGLCHGVCARGPVFLVCVYPVSAYAQLDGFAQEFRQEHGLARH